ncbi:MAG: LON peptidase substrate-binding domain-containing protein [Actinobacteria bacterium]|nr:LON peptidase substrate-binding domain-containing protein [Actinomycetota bacterium]
MAESIPLFPLGTVLFPGVVLPLHVFENRYRELVSTLIEYRDGTPREFGVVAIRQGWEVGPKAAEALFEIGTVASLRQVTRHPDGRFDIIAIGTRRFRLRSVDAVSRPYLVGAVDRLPEAGELAPRFAGSAAGNALRELATQVGTAFLDYVAALAAARGVRPDGDELPEEPSALSYLVASVMLLPLEERQALLAESSPVARLRAELSQLGREAALLRLLRAVPVPLTDLPTSSGPN